MTINISEFLILIYMHKLFMSYAVINLQSLVLKKFPDYKECAVQIKSKLHIPIVITILLRINQDNTSSAN